MYLFLFHVIIYFIYELAICFIIIIILATMTYNQVQSVSNQLPSGLVLVILIIHWPVNFLNTQL